MKRLRIPGAVFILLLSFLALSLSTSVPLAWAALGTITEFPVPTALSEPFGITLGPDGKMWFTESGTLANKIGRITTSGAVTEFPIPTPASSPEGITAGPDGNLWFTESGANKIGRITTSGVITGEFTIPTATSLPFAITAGPDGNLWFTESATFANKIGRITTSGVITEFTIPTFPSAPGGITAGPDGNLWFQAAEGRMVQERAPVPERATPRPFWVERAKSSRLSTAWGLWWQSDSCEPFLSLSLPASRLALASCGKECGFFSTRRRPA